MLDKNYKLGQIETAYVGEPIVKHKDYFVYKEFEKKVRASNDFVIKGPLVKVSGSNGEVYPIVGEVEEDGKAVYLMKIEAEPLLGFAVNDNGRFTGTFMNVTDDLNMW